MRDRRNFSLLEIVLALALLALTATLSGTLLFAVQQGWRVVLDQMAEQDEVLKLERISDVAFRNAVPFHWPVGGKPRSQLFRGRSEFLRLAYLHRVNEPEEGGIRFLELSLRGTELIARYRRYPILDDHEGDVRSETIVAGVRKLTFSYAFRENGRIAWQAEFESGTTDSIPLAIRMDVEFENGREICFLRRTAGSSASSSYGRFREVTYDGTR